MSKKTNSEQRLGQHFLKDSYVIRFIVERLFQLSEENILIEVGPGTGVITQYFDEFSFKKIFAIEIDSQFNSIFKDMPAIDYINADFLTICPKKDLKIIDKECFIFSNLNYAITVPFFKKIILDWLISDIKLNGILLMLEKSFADNLHNGGNWFCRYVQEFFHTKKLMTVKSIAFDPAPKVDGCLIEFTCKQTPFLHLKQKETLMNLCSKVFKNQRRKIKYNIDPSLSARIGLTKEEMEDRSLTTERLVQLVENMML